MKQNKHHVIGIIGGSGVGKTHFAKYLKNQIEAEFIEADVVGHQMLQRKDIIQRLIKVFGEKIVNDGVIDRKVLGSIVFNDKEALKQLNAIMHKEMYLAIEKAIYESTHYFVILEAAVMIEAKFYELVDTMILLEADEVVKLQRLVKKRHIDEEKAKSMIRLQRDDLDSYAQIILDTSNNIEGMKTELKTVIEKLREAQNEI